MIAKLRECVLAAGTENADQARDTDLPLKERFFIQPLSPTDAAQDIIAVKSLIDKKAWPYVQNGLRSSAGYLRYDLNTVISSKTSKDEKKYLKALSAQLFDSLNAVSHFFPI
jgi:photosystem II oxygen-evolving enhancer protein 3